jgi:hypothetical protein
MARDSGPSGRVLPALGGDVLGRVDVVTRAHGRGGRGEARRQDRRAAPRWPTSRSAPSARSSRRGHRSRGPAAPPRRPCRPRTSTRSPERARCSRGPSAAPRGTPPAARAGRARARRRTRSPPRRSAAPSRAAPRRRGRSPATGRPGARRGATRPWAILPCPAGGAGRRRLTSGTPPEEVAEASTSQAGPPGASGRRTAAPMEDEPRGNRHNVKRVGETRARVTPCRYRRPNVTRAVQQPTSFTLCRLEG